MAPSEPDGGSAGAAFKIRSKCFGPDVRRLRTQLLHDTGSLVEYPEPAA